MPRTISSMSSPWFEYLATVYRSRELQTPISLERLEAFYPSLLPVPPCTITSHLPGEWEHSFLSCDVAVCAAWLPRPEPSDDAVHTFGANRSYIRFPARNASDERPFGHLVVLQRAAATREPLGQTRWSASPRALAQGERAQGERSGALSSASSRPWIEVTRTIDVHEGQGDCECAYCHTDCHTAVRVLSHCGALTVTLPRADYHTAAR